MRLNQSIKIRFSTTQLKEFFGLKKDDYVSGGKFKRTDFENKTINVAIKEINEKSKCIKNLTYRKEYNGRRVKCYVFTFDYYDPNDAKQYGDTEWFKNIQDGRNKEQINQYDMNEVVDYPWWKDE